MQNNVIWCVFNVVFIRFNNWQSKFGKVYNDSEDRFRYSIYNAKKVQIDKHQEYSTHRLPIERSQFGNEILFDATLDEWYLDSTPEQKQWENYKVRANDENSMNILCFSSKIQKEKCKKVNLQIFISFNFRWIMEKFTTITRTDSARLSM